MSQKAIARPFGRVSAPRSIHLSPPSLRSLRKLIVPAALLVLWQILVWQGVYTKSQLPAPVDVFKAARQLWRADELWPNIRPSLTRVFQGFLIGSLVAI